MAEQITHDVVNAAQSMGDSSPIGVNATTTNESSAGAAPDTTTINKSSHDLSDPSSSTSTKDDALQDKTSAPETTSRDEGTPAALATEGSEQSKSKDASVDRSKEAILNGTGLSTEDLAAQHLAADTSGGSDTDTSRAGKDGAKPKKPTSFKSVSVTKNFLAKTAVSAPSKVGEKVSTSPSINPIQPTAKPRLVAKSGSGVGSSLTRSGLGKLNGSGTGPDPATVWNKNRPTPPPQPKQFTDEELKQQFGIHMATRLQADEDAKESKWADIEDDEEDWAPETVEWMDGTKSTVKPTENAPPADEPKKPEEKKDDRPLEDLKPAEQPSSRPSSTGPSSLGNKTILKPGAYISAAQAKQGASSLRGGQTEKPTLVAKSPAAPAKSPWAPLPPIEKVSPVIINPQPQVPAQARFGQRDPHGFDALPPVPVAAKEIAADDFNRTLRDDRGPRELFNSQSGKYEPVRDLRRGSRPDSSFRQPSVLQRPMHGGPAEPSAAFQTSRSSVEESWSRRRTSSNVSGGRRPSFSRVPEPVRDRRGSHSTTDMPPPPIPGKAGQAPRASFGDRGLSPAASNQGSWTQRSSPVAGQAQLASPHSATASPATTDAVNGASSAYDAVKIQEQMMREKIERAKAEKQKRQEEEAREEAARKERLRRKLEALGPAPTKDDKSRSPTTAASELSPAQKPATMHSPPPKPPIPTAEGEVAQYGMMKVHQPHSIKRSTASINEQTPQLRPSEARRDGRSPELRQSSPVKLPGPPASEVKDERFMSQKASSLTLAPLEREAPGWRASQAWGAGMSRQGGGSSMNVWGPPNRERGIGNGTFGHTQQSQPEGAPSAPGPIAPPAPSSSSQAGTSSAAASRFAHNTEPRAPDQHQTLPPPSFTLPPSDDRLPQSTLSQNPSAMPPTMATVAPPGQQAQPRVLTAAEYTAAVQLGDRERARANMEARIQQRDTPLPTFKHTWVKVEPGLGPTRRTISTTTTIRDPNVPPPKKVNNNAPIVDNPINTDKPKPQVSTPAAFSEPANKQTPEDTPALRPIGSEKAQSSPSNSSTANQSGRPSRFFPRTPEQQDNFHHGAPQAARDPNTLNSITSATAGAKPGVNNKTRPADVDAPPPPETSDHPAFGGNTHRPTVKLPQKIKVKLPPAADNQPAVLMPAQTPARPQQGLRFGSQPIVTNKDWQGRFDHLLGHRASTASSPPKTTCASFDVAPASKAPLDHAGQPATVSLPNKPANSNKTAPGDAAPATEVVSKDAFEEVMSVPEAFSTPTVLLPKEPHMNAGLAPASAPEVASRPLSHSEVCSGDPNYGGLFDVERKGDKPVINVRLPGQPETKQVAMEHHHKQGRKLYNNYNNRSRGRGNGPRRDNNDFYRRKGPGNGPHGRSTEHGHNSTGDSNDFYRRKGPGNGPGHGRGQSAEHGSVGQGQNSSGGTWGSSNSYRKPSSSWNRRPTGSLN
ncbi:hypothetical protein HDK90DRAFT_485864 [Phyllosticta capitalensis]|uniref:Uncharacterized protein n=1 Tax=Phyllosticta capitalensis TaxID=121624 RepID=A0ABR1YQX1_9PEZI